MLKTVVSGNNTPFTGKSFTAYHPVSQNWRDSYAKTPVSTTKPSRVQFEIPSTLGHLVDKIHGKWTFRVVVSKAKMLAYLSNDSPDAPGERVQNIKLLPNQARNMLDQWTILHNSTEAEVKKSWQLERMAREMFTPEETDYQHCLTNGYYTGSSKRNQNGGARYIYWKGAIDGTTGTWDDTLPNISYFGADVAGRLTYNMKSQHDCFRLKDPEIPEADFYTKYKYHYYHEIGLRDHPGVTTAATRDQIIAALFPGSTTELTFTFELTYEFQTPWHRNIKDAFAILNCVNHPEFWLYFRKPEEWIQNWFEVKDYTDLHVENFSLLTNYYDIPRQLWDSNFPLSEQKNWFTPEFQWHTYDKIIECTGNGHLTAATNQADPYETVINVNTIDRVARYLMVTIQSNPHIQGGNQNKSDSVFLDIVKNIWLEVNNERVLTKIETPVRLYNTKSNRFMYFGHEGNSFPNDIYILPLCIDCDMDNPGGGSVDMHPIYNNVKLHIKWDASKIEALAWSGDPNYAQPTVALPMPVFFSPGQYLTVSTPAPSTQNGLTNPAGSTTGAIVITSPSAGVYKYTIDAKITTTALVLDMITFDNGQLYKQGHS